MRFLKKLPGSRREPPGLERDIMARMPMFVAAGTAIPAFCYLMAPLFPAAETGTEKYLIGIGIYAIASVLTVWTAAFTVTVGCLIVMVMKGPAYVADPYPLSDAEEPRQRPARNTGERTHHRRP